MNQGKVLGAGLAIWASGVLLSSVGWADTYNDALQWLIDEANKHGSTIIPDAEAGDIKEVIGLSAPNRCSLVIGKSITIQGSNRGTSTATVPLDQVVLSEIGVQKASSQRWCLEVPTDGPAIDLTMRSRSGQVEHQKTVETAYLCLDNEDISQRSIKAMKDLAASCGAKKGRRPRKTY